MFIQSAKNERVKNWKKLLTRKGREKSGLFLVEGEHLVEEAHKAGVIEELIVTENYLPKLPKAKYAEYNLFGIANEIAKAISDTETPQGIFAVCRKFEEESETKGTRYLLLDAIQDPGNLGTIIRTADAAGIDTVILGEGCVDHYNSKVLRAAQGSHFHIPIIKGNLFEWIEKLQSNGFPVYGTSLQDAVPIQEVEQGQPFALIVGNEGQGVAPEILEKTTKNLYIPIYGKSESLNVSIATGILLYYLRGF